MLAYRTNQEPPADNVDIVPLSRVAHDLKTPLNAVVCSLDYIEMLLKEERIDRGEILQTLKVARGVGEDMNEMIHSLLAVARAETGQESFHPVAIHNLGQVLQRVVGAFRFEASMAGKCLTANISPHLPAVRWDMGKIHHHVLNSLIDNALKFILPGGRIEFSAEHVGDIVEIRVADNGPGISPEIRAGVFGRFKRGAQTAHGFGLGLYSASMFVRAHQGEIGIEDGIDGKGVAFVVRLPRYPMIHSQLA